MRSPRLQAAFKRGSKSLIDTKDLDLEALGKIVTVLRKKSVIGPCPSSPCTNKVYGRSETQSLIDIGLNSFRVFPVDASNTFQRAKSLKFSVTSVASARAASKVMRISRK